MYRAEGSPWARWAAEAGWTPPRIQDLARVLWQVAEPGVPVRAGLSEEGLSEPGGHYDALPDYAPQVRELLQEYNRTGDLELLREAATYQEPAPVSHRPLSFYEDVQARLGSLLAPVTGIVSTARRLPSGSDSAVFVAHASYTDPRAARRPGDAFGAGWTADEANAKAVLEAYERHLTRADPARRPAVREPSGTAVAFTRTAAIASAFMEGARARRGRDLVAGPPRGTCRRPGHG